MQGTPLKYRLSDFLKGGDEDPKPEDENSRKKSVLVLGAVIGATTLGGVLFPSLKEATGGHVSIPHISLHDSDPHWSEDY